MSWQDFGGEAEELYLALLKERCEQDGLGTADEVLARQFRPHLHRGIASLATPHSIRSLSDLIRLAVVSDDGAGREHFPRDWQVLRAPRTFSGQEYAVAVNVNKPNRVDRCSSAGKVSTATQSQRTLLPPLIIPASRSQQDRQRGTVQERGEGDT